MDIPHTVNNTFHFLTIGDSKWNDWNCQTYGIEKALLKIGAAVFAQKISKNKLMECQQANDLIGICLIVTLGMNTNFLFEGIQLPQLSSSQIY